MHLRRFLLCSWFLSLGGVRVQAVFSSPFYQTHGFMPEACFVGHQEKGPRRNITRALQCFPV